MLKIRMRPLLRIDPAPLHANARPFSGAVRGWTTTLPYRVGILSDSYDVASGSFRRLIRAAPPACDRTAHWNFHQPFSTGSCLEQEVDERKYTEAGLDIETSGVPKYPEDHAETQRSGDHEMNYEQQSVYDLIVKKRQNVFFTGPAGTGKSWLLKKIIEDLVKKHGHLDSVAVTASTGLAAYNIGGSTLHRFAGIGLGNAPTKKLLKDISEDEYRRERWLNVEVLIIDEVSMVDCTLFDKLDVIAQHLRSDLRPFGGIQLVITGDFFQLPPVVQGAEDGSPKFCFEAEAWKKAIPHTINLTQIYRQKDLMFANMLNEIRQGLVSPSTINKLRELSRPLIGHSDNGLKPTKLFPLRREAERANYRRLQKLPGPMKEYIAQDGGTIEDISARDAILKGCIAPEYLHLKVGAQVMLIKNIDDTLVNGSLGRVIGFANPETYLHDNWDDIHPNMLTSNELAKRVVDVAPEERLPLYPVIRFGLNRGGTRTVLCKPEVWAFQRWVPDPWHDKGWRVENLAIRVQVPLVLAWALSIHKAQGQTLSYVKVDLSNVFEKGQAYVALSRATSMDGLQVLNLDPEKVTAHSKVKTFYASLSKAPITHG